YRGSDIQTIKQLFNPNKRKDKTIPGQQAEFKDPSGLRVMLTGSDSPVPMPKGTPTTRTPISKLGKFGELTIPVKSLSDSLVFWSKLGFSPLHMAEIPYPYAILSDAMIVI